MITISTLSGDPIFLSEFAYKFLSPLNTLQERDPIYILQLGNWVTGWLSKLLTNT